MVKLWDSSFPFPFNNFTMLFWKGNFILLKGGLKIYNICGLWLKLNYTEKTIFKKVIVTSKNLMQLII